MIILYIFQRFKDYWSDENLAKIEVFPRVSLIMRLYRKNWNSEKKQRTIFYHSSN